jgi:hypothetical protein
VPIIEKEGESEDLERLCQGVSAGDAAVASMCVSPTK